MLAISPMITIQATEHLKMQTKVFRLKINNTVSETHDSCIVFRIIPKALLMITSTEIIKRNYSQ